MESDALYVRRDLLDERIIVADGNMAVVLHLEEAWADETAALTWRMAKLVLEIDSLRTAKDGRESVCAAVVQAESAAKAWLTGYQRANRPRV